MCKNNIHILTPLDYNLFIFFFNLISNCNSFFNFKFKKLKDFYLKFLKESVLRKKLLK